MFNKRDNGEPVAEKTSAPWASALFAIAAGMAAFAACSGGGGHTLPAVSTPGTGSIQLTLKVPSLASLQSLRRAAWVSPATKSVIISISPANEPAAARAASVVKMAYDVSPSSVKCTPKTGDRVCLLTIAAPLGSDVVTVDLYDGQVPSSTPLIGAAQGVTPVPMPDHLGTTTVVTTVAADAVNAVAFTVGGLPATLVITPATIVFTPYPYAAGGVTPAPSPAASPTPTPIPSGMLTTNVYVSALDGAGVTIVGPDSYGTGITVQLYGPATAPVTIIGAPNPSHILLTAPTQGQPLQLQYNRAIPYGAPISLVATSNGVASATSLVVNDDAVAVACTPQPDATSLAVKFLNLNPYGPNNPSGFHSAAGYAYNGGLFRIPMSIGGPYPTGSPYPPSIAITLDTGSVGLAVSTDIFYQLLGLPKPPTPAGNTSTPIPFPSSLPPGVTGPTGQGQITYTSDGKMEIGQFFTVPLNIFADYNSTSPIAVTVPTQILVVTNQGCNLHYLNGRSCTPNSAAHDVQNMGIGFYPLDIATVDSPVANPFLQLAQELYGPINRRYVINNQGMFFGGTASDLAGFQWIKLVENRNNPGDWMQPSMCVTYPGVANPTFTCGQMLVDTGLASMIMAIPRSQQIPNLLGYVQQNSAIRIVAPGPAASPLALDWTFNSPGVAGSTNLTPAYPAAIPNGITVGPGANDTAFINTSQRIIYAFDYAYDADCGAVGFRPASPAPPPQP